ncbi:MAG: sulfatase [Xanthomonadales bacterium]|nr:sulfatase [Xanthomonadales bacterium]
MTTGNPRIFLALLLCLTVLWGCSEDARETVPGLADRLPVTPDLNVLIVSFDALRADALGLYGNTRGLSPYLDQWAAESLVFNHAHTAAPVTPTSFAAAFTGQQPYRVFLGWKLTEATTIAQVFEQAGYYTFGLFNNVQLVTERHFDRGFQNYEVTNLNDDVVLDKGRQLLAELPQQPFFGWIHFISPHTPYTYMEMSKHLYDPDYQGRFEKAVPGEFDVQTPEELKRVKDLYDGEVFYLDHLFKELMGELERQGLKDNTLVVVTTDHGEEFMEHGQVQHNALYEELLHIPMIIHHPGGIPGRTDVPYSNVDLLPTLAAVAGIEHPPVMDGLDLTQPVPAARKRVSTGMTHNTRRDMSSTSGDNKFIVLCKPEYREELYNLASDPGEQQDLILDDPDLAASLFDGLESVATRDPCEAIQLAIGGTSPTQDLTPEQIEQLKSLGYIQ